MKKKDLNTLKEKEIEVLRKLLTEKIAEAKKTTSEMYSGNEKNLKKVKMIRREIAQISTAIREKEIVKEEEGKNENI